MGKELITSDGCAYVAQTKCKECTHVSYRQCPNYRREHARYLLRDILPFDTTKLKGKVVPGSNKIYYARNKEIVLQYAALLAIKTNCKLKKYSLNQAITIVLEGGEVDERIVIVDCPSKLVEPTKQQSVLESFADKMLLQGKTIFIVSTPSVATLESWNKL